MSELVLPAYFISLSALTGDLRWIYFGMILFVVVTLVNTAQDPQ